MAYIQMATEGRIGLLRQTAYDTIQTTDGNFHYFAFTNCSYAPMEQAGQLPLESGASAFPRGYFKSGVVFQGMVDLIPRLENRFGWILEAVCGDASTFSDQTVAQVIAAAGANVGVNAHQFMPLYGVDATASRLDIPYLTTHRLLPHTTAADQVGEISQDACIASLTMNIGAAGIVTSRLAMIGRANPATVWDLNPGWSEPTYDNDDTFAVTACEGSVSISITGGTPGTVTEFDAQAATITFTNLLLNPNQSRVIGSGHHLDHPNLGRTLTIDIPYLVMDYDVYMQCFSGAANPVVDAGWSCTPAAGNVDISVQSAEEISGAATTAYYLMRLRTAQGNVKWYANPLPIVPGRPVVCALRGYVCHTSSGLPYEWFLQNDTANYN